ncbi:MAG: preprotein translocase subunit SecG [Gemmatimonadales bacterium]
MYALLLVLLVVDCVILSAVILLQAGKGGGLAAMGGGASTDTFLGGRQAVTVLTKLSWWGGAIFLSLSLVLAGMSTRGGPSRSIIEGQIQAPSPVTPQPLPLELGTPAPTEGGN